MKERNLCFARKKYKFKFYNHSLLSLGFIVKPKKFFFSCVSYCQNNFSNLNARKFSSMDKTVGSQVKF